MIKIVALLDNKIGAGGGFDQALNAIVQMKKICSNDYEFEVLTQHEQNLEYLERLGIKSKKITISFLDKFFSRVSQNFLWHKVQRRIRIISPLEKFLISISCDIVYFLTPSDLGLGFQRIKYINTLWDLCHRQYLEFPEVSAFNEFFVRDNSYRISLNSALFTLTDSEELTEISKIYYGIDSSRLISMPFAPSYSIKGINSIDKKDVLEKYNIESGYYYYPAQFWAHKNHIRILQALVVLKNKYSFEAKVVFSGKDYGNLSFIEGFIKENGLQDQVKILGFVPAEDVKGLYENSMALVMPTYFGPTNLPPMEAWVLNIPVIYSKHLSAQVGEAAFLVNPDCEFDLADAMNKCRDSCVVNTLTSLGRKQIEILEKKRSIAEIEVFNRIQSFSKKRECWY